MNSEQISSSLAVIQSTFNGRGNENYGAEEVTQLQHALQCAALAEEEQADAQQISAALLHDIGHIMHEDVLPNNADQLLDDKHEARAYEWIRVRFGAVVADPIRLHVAAKRYLCSVDEAYTKKLSPTSYKSFVDQGGVMDEKEIHAFEAEPFFKRAVQLRHWDDLAKVRSKKTPALSHFEQYLEASLGSASQNTSG